MTLDIIIPTLNESKNLEALIPYLKSQIVNESCKLIVVDAYESTDNTLDICRENDVYYTRCKKCQRSEQMNLGAEASDADVLLFLHADVTPPDFFYSLIKNQMEQGVDAGMFAYRFDKESTLLKINAAFTKYDGLFAGGGDQCLFVKRKVFYELGKFNNDFVIMEDFDFFSRMKNNNISYVILQEKAIVSARKYSNNSYLRVNIVNLIAFVSFKCKVAPRRIRDTYQKWLH